MRSGPIAGFRWFWAYVVTGFDPTKHCQACFTGRLSPALNSTNAATGEFEYDIPEGALLYVCGVGTGPTRLRRERNLHLPLAADPGGAGSTRSYNGYELCWQGGRQISIPDPVPRPGLNESHFRCANFRVAESWFRRAAR